MAQALLFSFSTMTVRFVYPLSNLGAGCRVFGKFHNLHIYITSPGQVFAFVRGPHFDVRNTTDMGFWLSGDVENKGGNDLKSVRRSNLIRIQFMISCEIRNDGL